MGSSYRFINASEIARLIELIDLAPTFASKRLTVDQRRLRGYRYTYVGAAEDAGAFLQTHGNSFALILTY
eukprot:COSAG03_NODE_446_length_7847_cov_4.635777_3_plen_70_part_00